MTWKLLLLGASGPPQLIAGPPVYQGAVVSRNGVGAQYIDLCFDRIIESPGANYELGWTIEIRHPDYSYATLDPSNYTCALEEEQYVRVTLTGSVNTVQGSHQLRISYNDAVGDIRSASDASPLATFTNVTTMTNHSPIDLFPVIEWWDFEEAAGAQRNAQIETGANDNHLTDVNTVGQRAGLINSYAGDFTGGNYLFTSESSTLDVPVNGVRSIAFRFFVDTLPSVGGQDGYFMSKWTSTSNTRSFHTRIAASGGNQDKMVFAGENSANDTFFVVTDALSTGKWYVGIGVLDPTDSGNEMRFHLQESGSPGTFATYDTILGAGVGDPHAKQSGGTSPTIFGLIATAPTINGTDGAMDMPIVFNHALSLAEAQDLAVVKSPPFYPDTVGGPAVGDGSLDFSNADNTHHLGWF